MRTSEFGVAFQMRHSVVDVDPQTAEANYTAESMISDIEVQRRSQSMLLEFDLLVDRYL